MQKVLRLLAIAIVGASMLAATVSVTRADGPDDNWVQQPSSGESSSSDSVSAPAPAAGGDERPHLGSDDAPLTIVEYFDFDCPYCVQEESTLRHVVRSHPNQVRLEFADLVVHKRAMNAALAARCANDQGQYEAYREALLANTSYRSTQSLEALASSLGMDPDSFNSCLESKKYEGAIQTDEEAARAAGANGTPFIVVGKQGMNGVESESSIDEAIDRQQSRL